MIMNIIIINIYNMILFFCQVFSKNRQGGCNSNLNYDPK